MVTENLVSHETPSLARVIEETLLSVQSGDSGQLAACLTLLDQTLVGEGGGRRTELDLKTVVETIIDNLERNKIDGNELRNLGTLVLSDQAISKLIINTGRKGIPILSLSTGSSEPIIKKWNELEVVDPKLTQIKHSNGLVMYTLGDDKVK